MNTPTTDLKHISMSLSRIQKPHKFSIRYEQYVTSSDIAARMVYQAFLDGNIQGKKVADLGCGNGVLSVASALLGANSVNAYDIDPEMVSVATDNARAYPINVYHLDINKITESFDTVVMNPPWGASNTHADMPFIKKAVEIADHIYSIHNRTTEEFLDKVFNDIGIVKRKILVSIDVPRIYSHHTRKSMGITGIIYCVDVLKRR